MGDRLIEMAPQARPVAKFRKVTVHFPTGEPIEIPGGKVTAYGVGAPGLPAMVGWIDEYGRPNQVIGAVVHAVFDDSAGTTIYAPVQG